MSDKALAFEDFFVIRSPRLPLTQLFKIEPDEESTRAALLAWLEQPVVTEALYLASPSLIERIDKWRQDPSSKAGKKVEQALLKYMIRMCSRPTPFGLFSGISLGRLSETTALESMPLQADKRKTRLDLFYLLAIKNHLKEQAAESTDLLYIPNPSCYKIGSQCRYIEAYQSGDSLEYRLSAVEEDEVLALVLKSAKGGAPLHQLVEKLIEHFPQLAVNDAEAYLQDLVDESLLVADIPISLTGQSPDQSFVDTLSKRPESDISKALTNTVDALAGIDKLNATDIRQYRELYVKLNALPVEVKENKLFQCDTLRTFSRCEISSSEIDRIKDTILLLSELTHVENTVFSDFIRRFNSRYEGRLIALDKILDEESGFQFSTESGYESMLLAGLQLSINSTEENNLATKNKLEEIITKEINRPENIGAKVVRIAKSTLSAGISLSSAAAKLPASFAAMLAIYKDEQDTDVLQYKGAYGPSAANLLGRFCHLDEELKSRTIKHLDREAGHSKDPVFAEVVHFPEGRTGNVIARPHLRQYEIVFMANSNLPKDKQIPIDDLYVFVEGGKVKLWSQKLNRQVIPRLSSAHNYSARSLSVYKFLCMLQKQDGVAPTVSFPSSFRLKPFSPRIMVDNLIIFEKSWRISRKDLVNLQKSDDRESAWLKLQAKYSVDRFLSYSVGDNVLVIDLKNPLMLEILLAETKNYPSIELNEVVGNHYQSAVKSQDGLEHYSNEVILPIFNAQAQKITSYIQNPGEFLNQTNVKRTFSPGEEWMSFKLYTGNSTLENIIMEKLEPFIKDNSHFYKRWFFIRYGDPDWHMRIRFNGLPENLYSKLLPRLSQLLTPLIDSGEIHKLEMFTYDRELERYGGVHSIELMETIFMLDSELIIDTLNNIEAYDESIRWRTTMLATDRMLEGFGYEMSSRFELINGLRAGFGLEFKETSILRKQLGKKYKQYENQVNNDFKNFKEWRRDHSAEALELTDEQQSMFETVERWSVKSLPVINEINKLYQSDLALTCSKNALLSSILHMHNNRMFKAYGREQEFVMHDFMRKYYLALRHQPENQRLSAKA